METETPNEVAYRKQLGLVSNEGLLSERAASITGDAAHTRPVDQRQLVLIVIYSEKAWTGLKAARNTALTLIDFSSGRR